MESESPAAAAAAAVVVVAAIPAAPPTDTETNTEMEPLTVSESAPSSALVTPWQNKIAKAGDVVVMWAGHSDVSHCVLEPLGRTNNRFGSFLHDSLIGQPYGSRVFPDHRLGGKRKGTKQPYRHMYMLTPSPELWSRCLTHRTAILYPPDCSMIVYHLNLKPGSWVAESGTGSGSLSTSIARVIAPTGHLHTFEFNQVRAEGARADFKKLGTDKGITVHHRDACAEGFAVSGIVGSGEDCDGRMYDAVFLDLPSPWVAIPKAHAVLRTGGRLCSFSPCIEQVQRACIALRHLGFTDIRTYECLLREIQVQSDKAMLPPPMTVDRSSRYSRLHRIAGNEAAASSSGTSADASNTNDSSVDETVKAAPEHSVSKRSVKRMRHTNSLEEEGSILVKPFADMASHTGFLTFATRGV